MHERVDVAAGLAAWGSLRAAGSTRSPADLVPDWDAQPAEEMDDDVMIEFMTRIKNRKREDDE